MATAAASHLQPQRMSLLTSEPPLQGQEPVTSGLSMAAAGAAGGAAATEATGLLLAAGAAGAAGTAAAGAGVLLVGGVAGAARVAAAGAAGVLLLAAGTAGAGGGLLLAAAAEAGAGGLKLARAADVLLEAGVAGAGGTLLLALLAAGDAGVPLAAAASAPALGLGAGDGGAAPWALPITRRPPLWGAEARRDGRGARAAGWRAGGASPVALAPRRPSIAMLHVVHVELIMPQALLGRGRLGLGGRQPQGARLALTEEPDAGLV